MTTPRMLDRLSQLLEVLNDLAQLGVEIQAAEESVVIVDYAGFRIATLEHEMLDGYILTKGLTNDRTAQR